jgi:hypothetical protein
VQWYKATLKAGQAGGAGKFDSSLAGQRPARQGVRACAWSWSCCPRTEPLLSQSAALRPAGTQQGPVSSQSEKAPCSGVLIESVGPRNRWSSGVYQFEAGRRCLHGACNAPPLSAKAYLAGERGAQVARPAPLPLEETRAQSCAGRARRRWAQLPLSLRGVCNTHK